MDRKRIVSKNLQKIEKKIIMQTGKRKDNSIDTYVLNRFFTVPSLDRMVLNQSTGVFSNCVDCFVDREPFTIGAAIKGAYDYLSQAYRNEYYYKNTIINKMIIQSKKVDTIALTELPIGESKADLVVINGKGVVYEIKTDLDNLRRLQNQVLDYYKVFSYVYVVVSSKHINSLLEILKSKKIGVYELSQNGKLICRKEAKCEQSYLSFDAMFEVLRKKEYEEIILKYYEKLPHTNDFDYYQECRALLERINVKSFQKDVINILRNRKSKKDVQELEKIVPYELRFYAYFSQKLNNSYEDLLKLCNTKVGV